MAENNRANALSDSELERISGGYDNRQVVVTCTQCREGKIGIPITGAYSENCPKCGSLMICNDGKIEFCIPVKTEPAPNWDTDDSWL